MQFSNYWQTFAASKLRNSELGLLAFCDDARLFKYILEAAYVRVGYTMHIYIAIAILYRTWHFWARRIAAEAGKTVTCLSSSQIPSSAVEEGWVCLRPPWQRAWPGWFDASCPEHMHDVSALLIEVRYLLSCRLPDVTHSLVTKDPHHLLVEFIFHPSRHRFVIIFPENLC